MEIPLNWQKEPLFQNNEILKDRKYIKGLNECLILFNYLKFLLFDF